MKRKLIPADKEINLMDIEPEPFTDADIQKLCHDLRIYYESIDQLDLRGRQIGNTGITCLVNLLKNKNIKDLRLDNNGIEDDGLQAILMALKSNSVLEVLTLDKNKISQNGAKHIARFLETNNTLKGLSLGANEIGDDGLAIIARALKMNSTLEVINLESNSIQKLNALSDMLKVNTRLQSINLSRNRVGDNGAHQISEVIRKNTTLQSVSLMGCSIENLGCKALAEAIRSSGNQIKIAFEYNRMNKNGVRFFHHTLNVRISDENGKNSGLHSHRRHL